jgi:hypothetical protein
MTENTMYSIYDTNGYPIVTGLVNYCDAMTAARRHLSADNDATAVVMYDYDDDGLLVIKREEVSSW